MKKYLIITVFMVSCIPLFAARSDLISVQNAESLYLYEGKTVTLSGSYSKIMWTHVIAPPREYPIVEYFDSGKTQIVIYLKQNVPCKGKARITGKVIEIRGVSSPAGSDKKSKAEGITEYHIAVDSLECIE
jgi:hypothetical protein